MNTVTFHNLLELLYCSHTMLQGAVCDAIIFYQYLFSLAAPNMETHDVEQLRKKTAVLLSTLRQVSVFHCCSNTDAVAK